MPNRHILEQQRLSPFNPTFENKKFRNPKAKWMDCSVSHSTSLGLENRSDQLKSCMSLQEGGDAVGSQSQAYTTYVINQVLNKRHFSGREEKQKLMFGANYKPGFCILRPASQKFHDVRLKISLDGLTSVSGDLTSFPSFQF